MSRTDRYLVGRRAGPEDEVPGKVRPGEVESTSRRRTAASPWRDRRQQQDQQQLHGPHLLSVSGPKVTLSRSSWLCGVGRSSYLSAPSLRRTAGDSDKLCFWFGNHEGRCCLGYARCRHGQDIPSHARLENDMVGLENTKKEHPWLPEAWILEINNNFARIHTYTHFLSRIVHTRAHVFYISRNFLSRGTRLFY
jgi:hypothetical protein